VPPEPRHRPSLERWSEDPEPLDRIRNVEPIRRWRQDKGMLALTFRTPDGGTEVDLLVGE
jgi:hypothetical protein